MGSMNIEYVAFGTNGGFIPTTTTKYIYPDGKVCQETKILYGNSTQSVNYKIDVSIVNKLYQMFTDDICSQTYNVPASYCRFIEIKKNGVVYEWVFTKSPTFLENINDELQNIAKMIFFEGSI